MIVANPPYIAEHEVPDLPRDVIEWEPYGALVSGPTGMESIEAIVDGRARRGSTRTAARSSWSSRRTRRRTRRDLARAAGFARRLGPSPTSPAATGCWWRAAPAG